jgi:hypothetical protein
MKRTLILVFLSMALVPMLLAQSQAVYSPATICADTPIITAGATSNLTSGNVLDCRKAEFVALQFSFKLMGAATDNVTMGIEPSVDGTSYATIAGERAVYVLAANGTTTVTGVTNMTAAGYGYFRISGITNGAAQIMTNISVKYSIKYR